MYKKTITMFFLTYLLSGCNESDSSDSSSNRLTDALGSYELDGDPSDQSQVAPVPRIENSKPQLGMKLFFSKDLSGEHDTACVTCHHPLLGGGDELSLSIGVQATNIDLLGPGRTHDVDKAHLAGMHFDGGPTVPRNAPTTFNFALYKDSVFHDGRIEITENGAIITPDSARKPDTSVENLVSAQALFPITSPEEMASSTFAGYTNQELRNEIASRLANNPEWVSEFEKVYGADVEITYDLVAEAIASYEASQLFVDSPWKSYLGGDETAISESAKRGAELFYNPVSAGGAGCVDCHSGDFFTDEKFHNIALPQIGRGKHDGSDNTDDFGRFRISNAPSEMYAFRTPTLLNVEVTGPYGHAGSYDTLYDVIAHHLNPESAIQNYDFELKNLKQKNVQSVSSYYNSNNALDLLLGDISNGNSSLTPTQLSEDDINSLVEFMKALTDPCVKSSECLAPWIAQDQAGLNILVAEFK